MTRPYLFDLDGVLVDSMPQVADVLRRWALRNGLDADRVVGTAAGLPDRELVRRTAPHLDPAAEARWIEREEEARAPSLRPVPGALRLLRTVAAGPWAVVTSSSRRVAVARLTGAGLPLPRIMVTSDDVRCGKPDPEPYLRAAATTRHAPEECVVVEDSPTGVTAGRRAGAFVVGLADDHLPGADVTVRRLDHVRDAVRSRIGLPGDGRVTAPHETHRVGLYRRVP